MKIAVKLLVILGAVIGIVTGLGSLMDTRSRVVFSDPDGLRQMNISMILLLTFSAAAVVFGFIAAGKKSNRIAMVIFGLLIVGCGAGVILQGSYFPGGIFVVGGLVSSLGALLSKDFG